MLQLRAIIEDRSPPSGSSAIRKLEQHLFRILCANCVPDSEDTEIRENGRSSSRPISHPLLNEPEYPIRGPVREDLLRQE
jgi:hypothetical protein